ncbi:coilin isoform X1 [Drosophila guanche]|uniref:Blast:Nuclear pore complex protein Nup50 n=1 Tax=Drosophila guanche TaxID=7266 RepID=A0A3B0J1T1_DROGU|nr:coilin isoform X1 [Drosophila guanche]SPP75234.1 blast:Nuclear pore complex protein Nup50 [Drosophila guanche]
MEAFTMKIDLTNFFRDERQHALILIDSAWKNVEDVQHHIQNLFNLRNIRLLTNSGYFLPPKESLRVLTDADGLKAFTFEEPPPASGVEAGSTKTSNKRKKSFDEAESSRHSPPWEQPKRSKHGKKLTCQAISLNATTETPALGNSFVTCNTSEAEEPLCNSTINESKRFKQKKKSTLQAISQNDSTDEKVNPLLEATTCKNTTEAEEQLSNSPLNKSKRCKQKNKSTSQAIFLIGACDDKLNPSLDATNCKNTTEVEEQLSNSPLNKSKRCKQKNKSTLQSVFLNATVDERVTPDTSEVEEQLSNSTVNKSKSLKQKNKSTLHAIDTKMIHSLDEKNCKNTSEAEEQLANCTLNKSKSLKRNKKSTLLQITTHNATNDKVPTLETNETNEPLLQYIPQWDQSSSNDDENSKTEPPAERLPQNVSRLGLHVVQTPAQSIETQEPEAKENNSTLVVPEPPPISFRCPLMELDLNKVRTHQISFKAKTAQNVPGKSVTEQTDSNEHIKVATPEAARQEPAAPLSVFDEISTIDEAEEDPEAEVKALALSVDDKMLPRRVSGDTINCDSDDDVMVLDDSSVDSDVEVSQIVPANDSQMNDSALEMFANASPLTDLPKRGDTILFKLRKMKTSLSSGVTGVITASCTYINRRTKAISMEVISYPPRNRGVLSQYSNSLDDSSDDDTPSLMVNMSDLIEAKLRKKS